MADLLNISSSTRINLNKLPFALARIAPMSLLYATLADHHRMGAFADVLTGRHFLAKDTDAVVDKTIDDYRAVDGKFTGWFGAGSSGGGWRSANSITPWYRVDLDELTYIQTIFYSDNANLCCYDRSYGARFMVGNYPVTQASELGFNEQCAEGVVVSGTFKSSSGYYDCGLWGTYLIMTQDNQEKLAIMEIKAWSWNYLNLQADPALVTSSNNNNVHSGAD